MIKGLKETGVHLGKYKIKAGRFSSTQLIDFECKAELDNGVVIMAVIASYQVVNNENGQIALNVPCSTNFEFIIEDEMTVDDLMSIWKIAVKNLRNKGRTREEPLRDIPYPSNDQMKASILEFLKRWKAIDSDNQD